MGNTATINCTGTYSFSWTCLSTSASWNPGTSTINLNGTTAQTFAFNNGNSVNIYYYNVTISNSGVVNVTMGANLLDCRGLLNISTTTATIVWNDASALSLSGGLTIAVQTWTGNPASTALIQSQTITDGNTIKKNLGRVSITASKTIVYNYKLFAGNLVNGGTWANAPTYPLSEAPQSVWSQLTIGTSAVLTTAAYAALPNYVRTDGGTF